MAAEREQPADVQARGDATRDHHRLIALKAGARRLLEIQRSRIRIVEATLTEQAATLLELAGRQDAVTAELQRELEAERERLNREMAESKAALGRDEQSLAAERERLTSVEAEAKEASRLPLPLAAEDDRVKRA